MSDAPDEMQARLDDAHRALLETANAAIDMQEALDDSRRREAAQLELLEASRRREARLEAELVETHRAYRQSLSWRITAPLRRANEMRHAFASRVHRALSRFPQVHAAVRRIARALRLVPARAPAPTAPPHPRVALPPPTPPVPMTEDAQRVHGMLARKD